MAKPAIATGTFAMEIATPAIVDPIMTMIVVAQAAGVWPWLLMLDIRAPCIYLIDGNNNSLRLLILP